MTPPPASQAQRLSAVLLAFTEGIGTTLGVSEIARHLDIPKSAVHRTLAALIEVGLVERAADSSRYRLGSRATALAMAALGVPDVRTSALPYLQELARLTGESATLSLMIGNERIYIEQVEGPQDIRMSVEIGRRYPLYAGASGRSILAALPPAELDSYLRAVELVTLTPATIADTGQLRTELKRIHEVGYAVSRGERDPWAASVAAAVFGNHRVIGSMSVCGPAARITDEAAAGFGDTVRQSAANLSRALGHRPKSGSTPAVTQSHGID
ncbi:IclR family transcriptional regulator [Solwaraspora sp. WMMD406]|uniref:IclR family transcriptional regulator n=1 Tax=Solwaraspora sp. WMMD406 TaxID=3016095 RepID=UPI002416238C|nr:IclR family transcriptional regulator [Solwaraspora sp. WMMD406]MDG4762549.1 IclR family transcriptional regulator [Solwaraspora sp. WMMD406]